MFYTEEDMLMLSGIQHYVFCPRQWALIHIEQQWDENVLTVEGKQLHEHVDDPSYRVKNGDKIILRRVAIASRMLGLNGYSDAIELLPSIVNNNTIEHPFYPGYWKPVPIEYKRGRAKPDKCDEVQVAAQAICLEEMYGIHIPKGMIFYDQEKGRQEVIIDEELRHYTQQCSDSMHQIYKSGHTPLAEYKEHCYNCSLNNLCIPLLDSRQSVHDYLSRNLYEETS